MTDRALRAAAALAVVLALAACTPDDATTEGDDADGPAYAWPSVTEAEAVAPNGLAGDVVAYQPEVVDHTAALDVVDVQTVEQEAGETVVTLSSDILFDPSDATLSAAAEQRVGELVADVPDGAEVQVQGHTDTVDTDAANQDLSERRAQAVADAIAASRPDLDLTVEGFGESRLAQPETGDETAIAEARAANRRVEIRYEG